MGSLVDAVARIESAKITREAAQKNRILILDVERLPGELLHQFWGLSIRGNYRFSPETVISWPRTICFSALWYDDPKTIIHGAEWEQGGRLAMLEAAWQLYDEADIVVGHNIANADSKWLMDEWVEAGMGRPSPWKDVDTLRMARGSMKFESNQLGALCTRLNIPTKTDKYDVKVAQAAVDGDVKAQRRILKYNAGDIVATKALYDRLRPYAKGHPHLGLGTGDTKACPNCGGTQFDEIGDVRTAQTRYAGRRCRNCKQWVRNSHMRERMETRIAS